MLDSQCSGSPDNQRIHTCFSMSDNTLPGRPTLTLFVRDTPTDNGSLFSFSENHSGPHSQVFWKGQGNTEVKHTATHILKNPCVNQSENPWAGYSILSIRAAGTK